MSVAVITGSAGLVGAEATRFFAALGMDVIGIDNDMRKVYFGEEASTYATRRRLQHEIASYAHFDFDIRDNGAVRQVFDRYGSDVRLVIHAAAQPSHEWAAHDPHTDFSVNAMGTLNLLQATRDFCPEASFIFTSTNKVYGDRPNHLPLIEQEMRWEIAADHPYACGIAEDMSIDHSTHSLFGASKVAADILVQEYGRYFQMHTAAFRAGCLTGPGHAGTELHGFLAYLMKCVVTGTAYKVFGYKGKQVRDNIHSADLVAAFAAFFKAPRAAQVYNIGGGRESNCSMLEAIELCQSISGRELAWSYSERNRVGDHIWYIGNLAKFKADYPDWQIRYDVPAILRQIYHENKDRWLHSDKHA